MYVLSDKAALNAMMHASTYINLLRYKSQIFHVIFINVYFLINAIYYGNYICIINFVHNYSTILLCYN